jgi:hypothetical protein
MVDRVPFAVSRFGTTFSRGSRQLAFPRDAIFLLSLPSESNHFLIFGFTMATSVASSLRQSRKSGELSGRSTITTEEPSEIPARTEGQG